MCAYLVSLTPLYMAHFQWWTYFWVSAKQLRAKDLSHGAMNVYPKTLFPEVYILEGGYCQYFKTSPNRCKPPSYVTMDDPVHAASRREDLNQFCTGVLGLSVATSHMHMATVKLLKHSATLFLLQRMQHRHAEVAGAPWWHLRKTAIQPQMRTIPTWTWW